MVGRLRPDSGLGAKAGHSHLGGTVPGHQICGHVSTGFPGIPNPSSQQKSALGSRFIPANAGGAQ